MRLTRHREIHRVGDKAQVMRLLVKLLRQLQIVAIAHRDLRPQRHRGEKAAARGVLAHHAHGIVLIGQHRNPRGGAQMQVP